MQNRILTLALASTLSAGLFGLAPMAHAATTASQTKPVPASTVPSPAMAATSGVEDADVYQAGEDETAPDDSMNCEMDFTLSGWSALYKTADGQGTVTCDNGQTMDVHLEAEGGGLTAGTYKINDGQGNFNGVSDINQVLGTYAKATAHAGAVKSSHAAVMTKNDVTLTLTGTGNGWNIGVGFSAFTIERASAAANAQDQ